MEEQPLTENQSLELITSMIARAKNQFSENGHLYLLWGWLVFACSIAQFVLLHIVHYEKGYMVWLATWIAVIYQVVYLRWKIERKRVRTYSGEIIGYVWLVFVIALFLIGFLNGQLSHRTGQDYSLFIPPCFLVLYGIPSFLSGIILKFRPLKLGGVVCWALAIITIYLPPDYQILMVAAAMLFAWIIPGYRLRSRYRQENGQHVA